MFIRLNYNNDKEEKVILLRKKDGTEGSTLLSLDYNKNLQERKKAARKHRIFLKK